MTTLELTDKQRAHAERMAEYGEKVRTERLDLERAVAVARVNVSTSRQEPHDLRLRRQEDLTVALTELVKFLSR